LNARSLSVMLVIPAVHLMSDPTRGQNLESTQQILQLISDTADKICNVVSTKGEVNSSEVKGNVTAQLRGLARQLADVGLSGTGSITSEQYENVFRSDLASTLKDNTACRYKVFDTLQQKLLGSGPPPSRGINGPGTILTTPIMSLISRSVEINLISGVRARSRMGSAMSLREAAE
jgi:hypothetical protein